MVEREIWWSEPAGLDHASTGVNGGSDLVGDHLVGMRPGNVMANAFRAGFHLVAHRALGTTLADGWCRLMLG